ncbi:MAG: hypothetical protein DMD91_17885, partial [Candidatus Rokuibacteriota bacterium]
MADGSGHVPKAREVIDVDHDRALPRLEHVHAIDVQPKDFAHTPGQVAPLDGQRKKVLLHGQLGMKWGFLRDGIHVFADHIQFDVITRVVDVMLGQEERTIVIAHVYGGQIGRAI